MPPVHWLHDKITGRAKRAQPVPSLLAFNHTERVGKHPFRSSVRVHLPRLDTFHDSVTLFAPNSLLYQIEREALQNCAKLSFNSLSLTLDKMSAGL